MRAFLKTSCLCFLLALTAAMAHAQAQKPVEVFDAVRVYLSVDHVRQGSEFQGVVVLLFNSKMLISPQYQIVYPFRINSNQPHDPQLVPTTLEIFKTEGLTVGPIGYPKGEETSFKFASSPVSVYPEPSPTVIRFKARAAPDLPVGEYALKGRLTYQACNDEGCRSAQTTDITIPVSVVDKRAKVKRSDKIYFLNKRDQFWNVMDYLFLSCCKGS